MSDLAKALADKIIEKRRAQVDAEFYHEVTKKTYDKWFVKGWEGKKQPFLKPGLHGGYVVGVGKGARYHMLQPKYYSYKKVEHRLLPNRKDMADAVSKADFLSSFVVKSNPKTEKTPGGIDVTMHYDRAPIEYGSRYGTIARGITLQDYKYGKMSTLDKLLMDSISEWAKENGLEVDIDSSYLKDFEL